MQTKTAVIIPVYNEGENLKILIPNIYAHNKDVQVYVVDDSSSDDTENIIAKFQETHALIYLKRRKKLGRGTAVTFGFKKAFKNKAIKVFVEMDADLSHDPKELSKLVSLVDKNSIALASRYIPKSKIYGISRERKILSKFVNGFESVLFGLPIHDYTNGYRAYPRPAIELLIKHTYVCTGFASIAESTYFLYKKGFNLRENSTRFVNRRIGGSKADLHEMFISVRDLLRVRFSKI